jgi:hypothetical protein
MADIVCANATQAEVAAKIATAIDGDRVLIPTDTQTWTTGLTITKAITLQGNGNTNTVIRDGVASGALIQWNLVANKVSA